jgi:hypothetical protein
MIRKKKEIMNWKSTLEMSLYVLNCKAQVPTNTIFQHFRAGRNSRTMKTRPESLGNLPLFFFGQLQ